jgi:hypothetical protein
MEKMDQTRTDCNLTSMGFPGETPRYSPENSPAIFICGGEPWLIRYCWRIYFKVLEVLFLGEVFPAFLPSKKACGIHKFRHLGVRQQYPPLFAEEISPFLSIFSG